MQPTQMADPMKRIPLPTIIKGIIGAIVIIIGAVLVRRWWIRRQNA
ncbi:MAG: hypothetical protein M0Q91_05335 [Methanoregula sp.]|nr:hypothetical protein [Methanoregula sp.]